MRILIDGFLPEEAAELRTALGEGGWSIRLWPPGLSPQDASEGAEPFGVIIDGRRPKSEATHTLRIWRQANPHHTLLCLVDSSSDIPALLRAGAEDVVFPPHHPDEIWARLRARFGDIRWLNLPPCQIDLDKGQARWPEGTHTLTAIEIKLLQHFAQRPGHTVSREDLLTGVWGYHPKLNTRAVALAISRLRPKIEANPQSPRYLKTVYGVGYRMETDSAPMAYPSKWGGESPALFGRTPLIARIEAALAQKERLVVLHGPGGSGKSALARVIQEKAPKGKKLIYCDFSSLDDGHSALRVLGTQVGLPRNGQERLGERLAQALGGTETLVILDGCEGCLGLLIPFLIEMDRRPEVQFLLTSQLRPTAPQALVLPVPPLGVEAAVALFIARAKGRRPDYAPTQEATHAIHDLVLAVDTLPLAIELAASWISILSVAEIIHRLEAPEIIHSPKEGQPEAHRSSLSTTLDRSWGLLDHDMQAALVALSVLRSPFDLDTAAQLLPTDLNPIDTLSTLEDHSVLRVQMKGHTRRFAFPRPVQAFVLARHGTLEAQLRHGAYFSRVTEQLDQDLHGADVPGARQRFMAIQTDIRVAFSTCCEHLRPLVPTFLVALSRILWLLGDNGALDLFEEACLDPEDPANGEALQMKVSLLSRMGKPAEAWAAEALHRHLAERSGDPQHIGQAWVLKSTLHMAEGHIDETIRTAQLGLSYLTDPSQWSNRVVAHKTQSAVLCLNGQLGQAVSHLETGLEICEGASAIWQAAMLRGSMAIIQHRLGRPRQALDNTRQCLSFFQGVGDRITELTLHWNLAIFHLDSGDLVQADAALAKCEALIPRFGAPHDRRTVAGSKMQRMLEVGRYEEVPGLLARAQAIPGPTTGRWRAYVCSLDAWAQALKGEMTVAIERAFAGAKEAKGLKNHHQEGRFYIMMGLFLARLGDIDGAKRAIEDASERLIKSEAPDTPVLLGLTRHHVFEERPPPLPSPHLTNFPELRWAQRLWAPPGHRAHQGRPPHPSSRGTSD